MGNSLFGQGYEPKESSGSRALPADGYVCRILAAKIENAKSSGLPMLVISFDISEGEYKDYYRQKFMTAKQYRADAKWSGIARIPAVDENGKARKGFNSFCGALENSNDCKLPTDDELFLISLKDKYIGILMGREEYQGNDGEYRWSTKPKFYRSVETIRSGEFDIPKDEPMEHIDYSYNASYEAVDSFSAASDDIPFN